MMCFPVDVVPIRTGRKGGLLSNLDPTRIFAAVAEFYGLDGSSLLRRHDPHLARAVAAWLRRRHTEASLRQLAG